MGRRKGPSSFEVTASDLKDYLYCPRTIYWRYVLRIAEPRTGLMIRGKRLQDKAITRALELASLKGYRAIRRLPLRSRSLGMRGVLDALLVGEDLKPLEVKLGLRREAYKVQLTAYAMMVEEKFGEDVKEGFIFYPSGLERVLFTERLRRRVMDVSREVRRIVLSESLPDPTVRSRRCGSCEYYPFCRRI